MFDKRNNMDETAPKLKKKKRNITIVIVSVVVCVLVVAGIIAAIDMNSDKGVYLDFQTYMAKYVDYFSEDVKENYTIVWYIMDEDDLPEIEKYEKELLDNYDFVSVFDGDNSYSFKYVGDEDIAPMDPESDEQCHIRILINEADDDGKCLVGYLYSNDFENQTNIKDEKKSDNTNKFSGKKETLAEPLDFAGASGQTPDKNSVEFQSLFDYASDYMDIGKASQGGNLVVTQTFDGSEDVIEIIDDYMDLLCSKGMNFSVNKSVFQDFRGQHSSVSKLKVFGEWGLEYTGTANVKETCEAGLHNDEVSCAISIRYTMEYGKVSGSISYSASLEATDLGFRYGGSVESVAPAGKSSCAGLIRTKDGKYETSDGRFSVEPGEAVAFVDGDKQNCRMEYINYETSSDLLKVWDENDENLLRVFFSSSAIPKTGKFYDTQDLTQKYQWVLGGDPEGSFAYETPRVYQYVNSGWVTQSVSKDSPCDDVTLRIMYYSEDEQVAVYYVYSKSLQEVELLCAVDLSKSKMNSSSSPGSDSGSGSGYDSDDFFDEINEKKNEPCMWCNGSGVKKCPACGGDGFRFIAGKNKACDRFGCVGGKVDCPHCY